MLLTLAAGVRAQPVTTYNFQHYSRAEGIPQSQVMALAQDDAGYLWVGTYGGLARYNGHSFETFTTSDGLISNTIEALAPAPDGALAVGTRVGYCMLRKGRFQCPNRENDVSPDVVHTAVRWRDALWLGTNKGLIPVAKEGRQAIGDHDLPGENVISLAPDYSDGSLWIGTDRGLGRYDGESIQPVRPDAFAGQRINMVLHADGSRFVGTDRGLYRMENDTVTRLSVAPENGAVNFLDGAVAPNGNLWFGTNRGLLRISANDHQWLTRHDGLMADHVHQILVDKEGTLWFGTDNALSKLVPGPFTAYTERHGLAHPFVRAVAEDPDGNLWLGTKRGVNIYRPEGIESLLLPEPYDDAKIYAIAQAPGGGMLIGTGRGLLWWRDGGVERIYTHADGLPHDYVASLVPDPSGVWLGTRAGLARWREGAIEPVPLADAEGELFILAMVRDRRDRIWLGLADRGVLRVDGDRTRWFNAKGGLADSTVWSLALGPDGAVWVGTNGSGAFRIEDEDIRRMGTESGLASDIIWQVLADSRDNVWLYTNNGLDRLHDGRVTHHGTSIGLVSFEGSTNAAIEHSSGELYFGTGRGLIRYQPGARMPQPGPPPVVLERVSRAGGLEVRPGEALPHDFARITIEFAALSFRDESAIRYRYRLVGLSDLWSPSTPRPAVSYGQLAPGQYEFQVMAMNDSGTWTPEPARFGFSVNSRVWQTWWFWLTASLAGILLVSAGAWWRLRRLEAIRLALETEVHNRTLELKDKNEKLHRLSITDDLTGLYNRRHFLHSLEIELKRLSRMAPDAVHGLIILDLDHFKRVNDRFGHLVGDRVLEESAERIRQAVRDTDIAARYGGEEFAILLPDTPLAGAEVVAEKLRARFEKERFRVIEQTPFTTTASAGVAVLRQADAGDDLNAAMELLIQRADAALYEAKQAGRNRVRSAAS